MKTLGVIGLTVLVLFLLVACNPSMEPVLRNAETRPAATATKPQATSTISQNRAPETNTAQISPVTTPMKEESLDVDTNPPFPLSERGPYWAGNRVYSFVDESRNGRKINIQIYYPALKQDNAEGGIITRNAVPDMKDAPYPLIITGPDAGDRLFKSHLASYGFAMAIVRYPDSYNLWDFDVIDHPLDMLFVLDQIASASLEGLAVVVDTDNVGVAGYSSEGFYTQILSGVRIDPAYYLSFCEQAPGMELEMSAWYLNYVCHLAQKWDEFSAHVPDEITVSDDGLWQPITDGRIRAVMPMAEYGTWLYGERGLAMADRPMLIVAPTEDEFIPYLLETAYVFEHVGSPERFLISFVGKSHMMVLELEVINRINHFATAFFGAYLQGKSEYRDYFTEEFVTQFNDLAWGVYSEE